MSVIVTQETNVDDNTASAPLRLLAHKSPVLTTKFNNDSTLLASGGMDKSLILWDLAKLDGMDTLLDEEIKAEHYQEQLHKSAITWISWSNLNESQLFTASSDHSACLYDLNKAQKLKTFRHSECVNQLDNSKRDLVITCSDDGCVKLWDTRSKFQIGYAQSENKLPILTCCMDMNENRFYFSGIDPTVYCYDVRKLSKPNWSELNHSNNVTSLSLSNDANYLISKSIDGTIKYYDSRLFLNESTSTLRKRAKPYVFDGSKSTDEDWLIRAIFIEGEEKDLYTVATGSNDGFIYTWEFASRKLTGRLDGHTGTVLDLDYSTKRKQLVTSSVDGSLVLRNL